MTFSKKFKYFFLLLLSGGCASESGDIDKVTAEADDPVREIVEGSINHHGGALYDDVALSFFFRDRIYTADRRSGIFEYKSIYTDTTGTFERKLDNAGYTEKRNGQILSLSAKDSTSHASSVNSVLYFALLPGVLNDPAARLKLLGADTLGSKLYHRVELRFTQDDGGVDFDDIYLLWFDERDYSLDYLAYSFHADGGGTRFRKAYNSRRVNGLVFQDYENYRGPADPDSLRYVNTLYKAGRLELLSLIELNRLKVLPPEDAAI